MFVHRRNITGHTAQAITALPSAAMNEEQKRRWLFGFGLPESQELFGMWAVGNIVQSWRGSRWLSFLCGVLFLGFRVGLVFSGFLNTSLTGSCLLFARRFISLNIAENTECRRHE